MLTFLGYCDSFNLASFSPNSLIFGHLDVLGCCSPAFTFPVLPLPSFHLHNLIRLYSPTWAPKFSLSRLRKAPSPIYRPRLTSWAFTISYHLTSNSFSSPIWTPPVNQLALFPSQPLVKVIRRIPKGARGFLPVLYLEYGVEEE